MREIHPTSERIYQAVKQQLLGGAFRPGDRIDAAQLAEHHAASITPVRSALHRLVGEQLVDAQPSEGFHAPRVTEPGLRDLYSWNELVLQMAWRLASQRAAPAGVQSETLSRVTEGTVAAATADRIFSELGSRSLNEQCARAILSLNDRLHLARHAEGLLFADTAAEMAELADVFAIGRSADVQRSITAYHRRRLRSAADLVRILHLPVGGVHN